MIQEITLDANERSIPLLLSLIIPTVGRTKELKRLLASIVGQDIEPSLKEQVELIVVDQNDLSMLKTLLDEFRPKLNLEVVRIQPPHLSKAKNAGLKSIRGEIVAFPDDDCFYPPDTFRKLFQAFKNLKSLGIDALFGRGVDPDTQAPLLNYPNEKVEITRANDPRSFLGLQICQFYRRTAIEKIGGFDPEFSCSSKWGSGEDTDFAIRYLQTGGVIQFDPSFVTYHPMVNLKTMPLRKAAHYATGFGALCRKHELGTLAARKIVKQLGAGVFYGATLRPSMAIKSLAIAINRARGFWGYRS